VTEIPKVLAILNHAFQQYSKRRNIPLPVSEVVNELPFGVLATHSEHTIEGSAGRPDMQRAVDYKHRLTNRIDNALRVRQCFSQCSHGVRVHLHRGVSSGDMCLEVVHLPRQCIAALCLSGHRLGFPTGHRIAHHEIEYSSSPALRRAKNLPIEGVLDGLRELESGRSLTRKVIMRRSMGDGTVLPIR
jgi:hypothetical protein